MSKKIRESFENYAKSAGFVEMDLSSDGRYKSGVMEAMWIAWQASRADLVVELPFHREFIESSDSFMDADEVKWALDDVGVSYK